MRLIRLLPFILLSSPVTTFAEIGDIHTVKASSAVVRETPDKKGKKVEIISQGSEVMEMDTQGEWMEIYVASTDLSGWMHLSTMKLLGGGTPAPAPAAAPAAKTEVAKPEPQQKNIQISGSSNTIEIKDFKKYLLKYNARTFVLKGYTPFLNAKDSGDGKLLLTVTDAWLNTAKARQKSSLIILNSRWKRANDNSDTQIIAIDESGNEVNRYPQE
jgi:hypothetical protein